MGNYYSAMRFRAILWQGDKAALSELVPYVTEVFQYLDEVEVRRLRLRDRLGDDSESVDLGDWIVRSESGHLYRESDSAFRRNYFPVEERERHERTAEI